MQYMQYVQSTYQYIVMQQHQALALYHEQVMAAAAAAAECAAAVQMGAATQSMCDED